MDKITNSTLRIEQKIRGGETRYLSPTIELVEISAEQGFAQSGGVSDPESYIKEEGEW